MNARLLPEGIFTDHGSSHKKTTIAVPVMARTYSGLPVNNLDRWGLQVLFRSS
jgi:hypothetical protein